jgi:hypothetical protein
MNTAANLLVILLFLSALYTFLGLVCGLVEKVQEVMARPRQRRRVRKYPRRSIVSVSGDARAEPVRGGNAGIGRIVLAAPVARGVLQVGSPPWGAITLGA